MIRELSAPTFPNAAKAIEMVRGLPLLGITREVEQFAELLVTERVMPGPATGGDALHVAAAAIYGMEYILTWNVKHLANPNERIHFGIICMRLGLAAPMLITPDLLQERMMADTLPTPSDETAVDDVRRIREQIECESGGDMRTHLEQTNRIVEEYREKLGLKVVQPPSRQVKRDGTSG